MRGKCSCGNTNIPPPPPAHSLTGRPPDPACNRPAGRSPDRPVDQTQLNSFTFDILHLHIFTCHSARRFWLFGIRFSPLCNAIAVDSRGNAGKELTTSFYEHVRERGDREVQEWEGGASLNRIISDRLCRLTNSLKLPACFLCLPSSLHLSPSLYLSLSLAVCLPCSAVQYTCTFCCIFSICLLLNVLIYETVKGGETCDASQRFCLSFPLAGQDSPIHSLIHSFVWPMIHLAMIHECVKSWCCS